MLANIWQLQRIFMPFFKVTTPCPVLNTPNFQEVFGGEKNDTLKTDEKGHLRELEFIAFKEMVFEVIDKTAFSTIFKVKAPFYPSNSLFIDRRFGSFVNEYSENWKNFMFSKQSLLSFLETSLGLPYLWGGNCREGIKEILNFYPMEENISKNMPLSKKWQLMGIDCSGLLYEATNGLIPRNTSKLISFGAPLPIASLSIDRICSLLKPLDMIVYIGHVIIVLDNGYTIESRENLGVIKTPLKNRFEELHINKKPSDHYESGTYLINRWL
jgi:hypothetical protein